MKLELELAPFRLDKQIDPEQVEELLRKLGETKAEMFLAGWNICAV